MRIFSSTGGGSSAHGFTAATAVQLLTSNYHRLSTSCKGRKCCFTRNGVCSISVEECGRYVAVHGQASGSPAASGTAHTEVLMFVCALRCSERNQRTCGNSHLLQLV